MTSEESKHVYAAKHADWQQFVLNGGPPCFHLEESDRFCLRAERWLGHSDSKTEFPYHKFVSLAKFIESQAREIELLKAGAKVNETSLVGALDFGVKCNDDLQGELTKAQQTIAELQTKLTYAEDAAAKGDLARQHAGRMEMEIAELRKDKKRFEFSIRNWGTFNKIVFGKSHDLNFVRNEIDATITKGEK